MGERHSRTLLVAAFAAIYLIWGSTYLAIALAIETIPPFLMAGARFLVAGTVLYAWTRTRGGRPRPSAAQWRTAAVTGVLLLLGGNGGVVWAEQHIPSGLAALLVATVPLFMVLLDWRWNGSPRPTRSVLAGLALGFLGVVLLVGSPGSAEGALGIAAGVVVLLAALSWAVGSIYSRRVTDPPTPRLGTAMQMLAGGAALTLAGVAAGEPAGFDPGAVSVRSWLALGYLIVFGSLIAFTAYVWLLRASTPARVSTYAYVNPAVALFLGWGLLDEPLSVRTLVGSSVILAAVVLVTSSGGRGVRVMPPSAAPRDATNGVGLAGRAEALDAPTTADVRARAPSGESDPPAAPATVHVLGARRPDGTAASTGRV